MHTAPIFLAVVTAGIGISCVVWPLELVTFFRWFHRKKPKWVQELPFADTVMQPWVPTYFRILGVVFCLSAVLILSFVAFQAFRG
jgi:hypothetical protein